MRIPEYDEPEPDVAIIRGSDADYKHRLPEPRNVGLLVEVSRKSVNVDRRLVMSMGPPASPLTGLSTWSTAGSKSTPIRGQRVMRPGKTSHPVSRSPS